MSQKSTILKLLQDRGELGVHSFEFYAMRMPRGAAAICDLKKEGQPIESVPERTPDGAEGVRYFLRSDELVSVGTTTPPDRGTSGSSPYDAFGEFS
jgi:hypothetical protein